MAATSLKKIELEGLLQSKRLGGALGSGQPAVGSRQYPLDEFLQRGLLRGRLTQLCGPASSGRTSLMLALLAGATRRGEAVAVIDSSAALDPTSAEGAGIELTRLLWVRSTDLQTSLKAAEVVIIAGGFSVIALDLASAPARLLHTIPRAIWIRLQHALEQSDSALVTLLSEPVASAVAAATFHLCTSRPRWQGSLTSSRLLHGIDIGLRRQS
ncbi:MAG: hypothetical protein ACR2L2_00460 [Acidobacteriota bacterium]